MIDDWFKFSESRNVSLSDCVIFKDDVSSAFAQFNLNAASSRYLAVVWHGYVVFHLVGLFGWGSAPIVFGLLSRAWLRLVRSLISHLCCIHIYVDDSVGLCLIPDGPRCQTLTRQSGLDLFGPGSMDPAKSCPPCQVQTVIGWQVNLVTQTLRPSDRGIDKLFFAFFSFNISTRVSLHLCQVLASLAQRYAFGLKGMYCFVHPLHDAVAKFCNAQHVRRHLDSAAKFCVLIWRVSCIGLFYDRDCFSVPLCTLRRDKARPGSFLLITDAGPRGLGAALFCGASNTLLFYSSFFFDFDSTDPSFQNCREYLGFLFGLLLVCECLPPQKGLCIAWQSDNISAISWVLRHVSKSPAAQKTLLAVTWLILRTQFDIVSASHIPGSSMGNVDKLSRDLPHSFTPTLFFNMQSSVPTNNLMNYCNPLVIQSLEDHLSSLISLCDILFHFTKQFV